jgi:hypothetical protein
MQGFIKTAALLAGCAIIAAAGTAQVRAQDTAPPDPLRPFPPMRIQCSPARVEGTQCPQPSGVCPDTTLGIGGNYMINNARQIVIRYGADWHNAQRVHVRSNAGSVVETEESDPYFNAYVTMTFHLGDANTPITYTHSIFPITGSNRANPTVDRPTLQSTGTCVRIPQGRR